MIIMFGRSVMPDSNFAPLSSARVQSVTCTVCDHIHLDILTLYNTYPAYLLSAHTGGGRVSGCK